MRSGRTPASNHGDVHPTGQDRGCGGGRVHTQRRGGLRGDRGAGRGNGGHARVPACARSRRAGRGPAPRHDTYAIVRGGGACSTEASFASTCRTASLYSSWNLPPQRCSNFQRWWSSPWTMHRPACSGSICPGLWRRPHDHVELARSGSALARAPADVAGRLRLGGVCRGGGPTLCCCLVFSVAASRRPGRHAVDINPPTAAPATARWRNVRGPSSRWRARVHPVPGHAGGGVEESRVALQRARRAGHMSAEMGPEWAGGASLRRRTMNDGKPGLVAVEARGVVGARHRAARRAE